MLDLEEEPTIRRQGIKQLIFTPLFRCTFPRTPRIAPRAKSRFHSRNITEPSREHVPAASCTVEPLLPHLFPLTMSNEDSPTGLHLSGC